ncbi:hypothetical protein AUJ13_05785 [Candidatus Micrarchaeota archaeon CG1_02_49_24]|nr:MAG: hypothetical protein AUJ13_05785 [Candidatus Micrarchaeota archaeon CG1_02_49_24]
MFARKIGNGLRFFPNNLSAPGGLRTAARDIARAKMLTRIQNQPPLIDAHPQPKVTPPFAERHCELLANAGIDSMMWGLPGLMGYRLVPAGFIGSDLNAARIRELFSEVAGCLRNQFLPGLSGRVNESGLTRAALIPLVREYIAWQTTTKGMSAYSAIPLISIGAPPRRGNGQMGMAARSAQLFDVGIEDIEALTPEELRLVIDAGQIARASPWIAFMMQDPEQPTGKQSLHERAKPINASPILLAQTIADLLLPFVPLAKTIPAIGNALLEMTQMLRGLKDGFLYLCFGQTRDPIYSWKKTMPVSMVRLTDMCAGEQPMVEHGNAPHGLISEAAQMAIGPVDRPRGGPDRDKVTPPEFLKPLARAIEQVKHG